MSADTLSLLVMLSCAVSCGSAVALGEHLYCSLTKQPHGDLTNGDRAVVGDWPRIPDDFPTHNGSDTL